MATEDYGHYLTDKSLEELERQIAQVYKEAADEMSQTVTDYFAQFAKRDEEQKKLVESGELSKADYQQWRTTQMARGQRYEAMRDKLAERYTNANEVADAYVNDLTPEIYSLNRNYSAYQIEQAGADADFSLWDESTVRRLIAQKDTSLMPSYPVEKAVQRGIDLQYGKEQITKSITSGILQGKSVYKIADDLQSRMENMSRESAIRTARTAITEAENAGRQDAYQAARDMGIDCKKQWLATLDAKTRDAHRRADGQIREVDEPFIVGGEEIMYPARGEQEYRKLAGAKAVRYPGGSPANVYNCRCTMIPVLNEVTDNGERYSKDYSEWLDEKIAEPVTQGIDLDKLFEGHTFGQMLSDYKIYSEKTGKRVWSQYEKACNYWRENLASKNLTEEQYWQIEEGDDRYARSSSNSNAINAAMRDHPGQNLSEYLEGEQLKTAETLRDVISQNEIPEDALLTRYIGADAASLFGLDEETVMEMRGSHGALTSEYKEALSPIVGTVIQENQFVSCSGNEQFNEFDGCTIKLQLETLKGTKAYVSTNAAETEVILDSPRYEITGYSFEYTGYGGTKLVLRGRVIP